MAGPRAPIGTLSQHAAAASNLVRKMVPGRFRGEQGRDRKPEPVKDESDSDSDSTSETSSETDTSTGSEADNSTSKNWAEGLRNKAKPNGVKFEPKKGNSVKESESKSDSESERDSESQSENTKANPKDKIDVDEESESSSESESDDEMADAPPMKAPPSPNTIRRSMAAHTSESSSSESSDDEIVESDESEDEKQAEAEAESESESEEEVPPKQQTQPVKLAPKEAPKSKPFTNGTKSMEFVSVSESSSESDEEEEPTKTVAKDNSAPRDFISQGFYLRKAEEDLDAAAVAAAFKKAKAEGKQIWYFTAPKSVPIEVIQKATIPLDKVAAGLPILSHDGTEYTGTFETPVNHQIKILVPGKLGNKYETLSNSVDKVLHITRVARFSEANESKSTTAVVPATSKAPRTQPKGLKARYRPIGVTSGAMGSIGVDDSASESDVEITQAPSLDAPMSTDDSKKATKKRKHGDVEKNTPNGKDHAATTPAKKSKKARVDNTNTPTVHPVSRSSKETPIAPPPVPSTDSVSKSSSAKKGASSKPKKNPAELPKPTKVTPVLPPPIPVAGAATNAKST